MKQITLCCLHDHLNNVQKSDDDRIFMILSMGPFMATYLVILWVFHDTTFPKLWQNLISISFLPLFIRGGCFLPMNAWVPSLVMPHPSGQRIPSRITVLLTDIATSFYLFQIIVSQCVWSFVWLGHSCHDHPMLIQPGVHQLSHCFCSF